MKRIFFATLTVGIALLTLSCEKEEQKISGEWAYFIFGSFYGYCVGPDCIQIFKIEEGKLYEDTLDIYPNGTDAYEGSYIALDAHLYDQVVDIMDAFPEGLYDEEQTVIGQPDAGDWGGKYVGIHRTGSAPRFWLLDNMASNMPAPYNEFVKKIDEKIALINQ